jgi:hypothetical protein
MVELPRNAGTELVHVMYWNIFHEFTLTMTSAEFHSLLQHNIMFLAETDMLPGEEDIADVTDGLKLGVGSRSR